MNGGTNPYGHAAVKRGIAAFLAGRAFSAGLTFVAFGLSARLLTLPEYGIYAAALALMELGLALSSGGLDWVASRVLPEFRMHAGGRATVRMVMRLGAIETLILLVSGSAVLAGAKQLAMLLHLASAEQAFELTGILLVLEGVGRLSRDQMLGILMDQRSGQIAQVVRAGTLVIQLGYAWHHQMQLDAHAVLMFELIAAGCAATAGAALLAYTLMNIVHLPMREGTWKPPARKEVVRLALHTYASYLLAMAYGPQVMTMLIARLLGAEAVAVFGFARTFSDQVRRYLPTDLLQSVVRPTLIAFYSEERNFSGLMLRLGLWLKTSVVVLLPLLVFFCAFGELGMEAIGGHRFVTAWPIVVVLLCGTGMLAWRRIVELACYAVMAADICVRSTLVLVVVPPVMAGILFYTGNLLFAVVLVVMSECAFCWQVMRRLRKRGYMAALEYRGFMRLFFCLAGAIATLVLLREFFTVSLFAATCATMLVCAVALRIARPLSEPERALVFKWNPRVAILTGHRLKVQP